jgi:hypothetical protein
MVDPSIQDIAQQAAENYKASVSSQEAGGGNGQENAGGAAQDNGQGVNNGKENGQGTGKEAWQLDLEKFNGFTGREFKTPDEVKSYFENDNTEALNDYKTKYSNLELEHNRTLKEIQEFIDSADPLKRDFGGDENAYRRWRVETDLSNGKDKGVISRIMNTDLDKLSDLEVISLHEQYHSPRMAGKDSVIKRGILEDLGVNFDEYKERTERDFDMKNPDLSDTQDYKLASKASQARNFLNNLITDASSKVELPKQLNIKEEIQTKLAKEKEDFEKLQGNWGDSKNKIKDKLKEVSFSKKDKEGNPLFEHTHQFNDDVLTRAAETVAKYAVSQGYEMTEENLSRVVNQAKGMLLGEHIEDILYAAIRAREDAVKEEYDKKIHNKQPLNKTDAPSGDPTQSEQVQQALRKIGVI